MLNIGAQWTIVVLVAVMAVGAAGALTATVPVEWVIGYIGWRALFAWLSVTSALCAAVLFFVVTDNKSAHPKESLGGGHARPCRRL